MLNSEDPSASKSLTALVDEKQEMLVGERGIEPPTPWSRIRSFTFVEISEIRAAQISHGLRALADSNLKKSLAFAVFQTRSLAYR